MHSHQFSFHVMTSIHLMTDDSSWWRRRSYQSFPFYSLTVFFDNFSSKTKKKTIEVFKDLDQRITWPWTQYHIDFSCFDSIKCHLNFITMFYCWSSSSISRTIDLIDNIRSIKFKRIIFWNIDHHYGKLKISFMLWFDIDKALRTK